MFEELKKMICNYVEAEKDGITSESRFIEDLGFTSYDFMSMLGELEDTYDIEVEEEKVMGIKTVGDAAAYIEGLRNEM